MKKSGIINAPLSGYLARLGHTDTVVIADAGLPIPAHVPVVDLAVVLGLPRFGDVLSALLSELVIEECAVASEAGEEVRALLPTGVAVREIDHEQLKVEVADASVVIRTGETTSFANFILRCGVPF